MKKVSIKFNVTKQDLAFVRKFILKNYGLPAEKFVNSDFIGQMIVEFGYREIQLEEQLLAAAFKNQINYDVLNDWQVQPRSIYVEKPICLAAKINSEAYTRVLNSLEYLYPEESRRNITNYRPNDFLAQLGVIYIQRQAAKQVAQSTFLLNKYD